jgi:hypothetical protein
MRVFALLRPPFPVDDELVGDLLRVAGDAMDRIEAPEPDRQALVVLEGAVDALQDLGYVVYWEY